MCPSFPLPCPNNCDLVLQRQELEQHVRNDCPLTRVHCDFHVAGCGEYLARRDMPSHISENIFGHMSHLQRYMTTHRGANMAECMGLMVGTIQKMALENAYTRSQLHEAKEELFQSHDQLRQLQESHDQLYQLKKSHDHLKESHDQLLQSHENLHESHDQLYKSHDQLHVLHHKLQHSHTELSRSHDTLSKIHIKACETYEALHKSHDQLKASHDTQNEEYQKQIKESRQLANKMENSQEKIAQLERVVTTLTTRCEEQEIRIGTEHVAMTQSHEMVSQQVSGLRESLAQQKDELTTMMRASEEKLDKSLATTETKFQTSLATSEAKLERSLVISEEKLQASLAEQQTMITECSNENRRLSQTITEQERKQDQKIAELQEMIDKKKSESMEIMRAMENQLRASLAALETTILAKYRDENTQLRQVISEQERKQQENEATVMALKDDFSHKIATSEQNIRDQEATLTLHQQTLERITCTGELPFNFTMTEFKSKKNNNVVWDSPPFYTHTHGYRMCIRVDANGIGVGKGTHLSVFAYLMQGPYDDDLLWLFQGTITIQLLNQLEDGNHHTRTINFTVTTDPKVINRVTSGERAGSGLGIHTFLPHTQLDLNSKGNCQYLKDDQLKFRVSKAINLDLTSHIHRRCLKLESFAGAIEPQVAVAPIEFTLSDFEQLKNQNSVWFSPAFYTHQRGYRMCLRVCPNGIGDGQGTHVSIFTCLMRGPFDGGLKWPFRGDITIQIVDQAGEKHHEKVVHYNNNTPDSYANRVTDGECSVQWVRHEFLPHTSLGYNTATNTQYLRANSLQIRIAKVKIKK